MRFTDDRRQEEHSDSAAIGLDRSDAANTTTACVCAARDPADLSSPVAGDI